MTMMELYNSAVVAIKAKERHVTGFLIAIEGKIPYNKMPELEREETESGMDITIELRLNIDTSINQIWVERGDGLNTKFLVNATGIVKEQIEKTERVFAEYLSKYDFAEINVRCKGYNLQENLYEAKYILEHRG